MVQHVLLHTHGLSLRDLALLDALHVILPDLLLLVRFVPLLEARDHGRRADRGLVEAAAGPTRRMTVVLGEDIELRALRLLPEDRVSRLLSILTI